MNDYKIRRWYAGTLGHFDKRGDKDWVINGLIEYIYLKYIIIILSYVPPPPLSFSNQANEPAYQRTSEKGSVEPHDPLRRKNSKNAEAYRDLPDTFRVKDVMAVLDIENNPANQQCKRWLTHGFIERIKQGKYKKIIKDLMV